LRAVIAIVVVLAGVAIATPALSHAALVSAIPANDALLDAPPGTLTLTFNEPVEVTVLRLAAPNGEIVDLNEYAVSGNAVMITPPDLVEGTHILTWRVVSADGHPIGGAIAFSIGRVTPTAIAEPQDDPLLRPLMWIARVAIYLGLFIGVAGSFFAAWIATPSPLPSGARSILRWTMIGGLVAVPISFALQGVDLLGESIGAAFTPSAWAAALESNYSATLLVATAGLIAGLVSLARPARAQMISGIGLLAVGVAFSLSGHASRAPPEALTWLVVFTHTTAVAFWAGSLGPLAFMLRDPSREATAVLSRFSAIVPYAIAPLIIAGVLLILVQLDSITDLWSTAYGRILVAKLAAVTALFILAMVNRYRLTPAIKHAAKAGGTALRRSIVAEIAIVVVVLGLVAGWRFTPPPRAADRSAVTVETAAPFFNHFHGAEMAADVTVTPGQVGPIAVAIVLYTGALEPLAAEELTVALTNERAGIGPLERPALLDSDGTWHVDGFVLTVPGTWTLHLAARLSTFDQRTLSGPIAIGSQDATQ
jgi:copper transport protein